MIFFFIRKNREGRKGAKQSFIRVSAKNFKFFADSANNLVQWPRYEPAPVWMQIIILADLYRQYPNVSSHPPHDTQKSLINTIVGWQA